MGQQQMSQGNLAGNKMANFSPQGQKPQYSPNNNIDPGFGMPPANTSGPYGPVMRGGTPGTGTPPGAAGPAPIFGAGLGNALANAGAPNQNVPPPAAPGPTGIYGQGGAALPPEFARPSGPIEDWMTQTFGGGVPFMSDVARGRVPTAIMQQYQQQQQQLRSQLADQMGGSRFGSDYAGAYGRESGRALTNLMANTQQNAIGVNQALGQGLLANEGMRWQGALQNAIQDFTQTGQLPPAIAALLGAMSGVQGGSQTGSGQTGLSI